MTAESTKPGDQIQVGDVTASTSVAIGAGAQATTIIHQAPTNPTLHQLRAPVGDFIGRAEEIADLVTALRISATSGRAAAISGLRGMGGVGKTELALKVAQTVSPDFPDAQLVVALRGVSQNPLTPAQALQAAIRAFERETKLPDDVDALRGIYIGLLSGKRALILADDAHDEEQVRGLLPPSGCALLVTSRTRFSLPGMYTCDLNTLRVSEAEQLLLAICPRIAGESTVLATLCGFLPLALRVSASLLQIRTNREVERYVEQLRAERLKYLTKPNAKPDDPEASVAASLTLSFVALLPQAQVALATLSVFPSDFDQPAALAVLGTGEAAEEMLEQLLDHSLIQWRDNYKRYVLHDLVRVFAAQYLSNPEAPQFRHARHYLAVAEQARSQYHQGRDALLAGLALFDDVRAQVDTALNWAIQHAGTMIGIDQLLLDYANATTFVSSLRYDMRHNSISQLEEQRNTIQPSSRLYKVKLRHARYYLVTVAERACSQYQQGRDALLAGLTLFDRERANIDAGWGWGIQHVGTVEIDQLLLDYANATAFVGSLRYDLRRAFIPQLEAQRDAARRLGLRTDEGNALMGLVSAYAVLRDVHKCIDCCEQALTIYREISDRQGEAIALMGLGRTYCVLGDTSKAISYYKQALEIDHEIGHRRGDGYSLGNLGDAYSALGDAQKAITYYEQHLVITRESGDRRGESSTLSNLGNAYRNLADLPTAINYYEKALIIDREIGDRQGEGTILGNLGGAYATLGDVRKAIDYYEHLLVLAREISDQSGEAQTSWNLGRVLEQQGDLERAVMLMSVYVAFLQRNGHANAAKCAQKVALLRQRLSDRQQST